MARVRECWRVLESNRGLTRFSPLAARKAYGLADRTAFSGRTSRKRRLDEPNMYPFEKLLEWRIKPAFSLGPTPPAPNSPTPVPDSRGELRRRLRYCTCTANIEPLLHGQIAPPIAMDTR